MGRLGGDEFLAILPQINQEGAVKVAERIGDSIKNIEVTFEANIIKASMSIGVASYTQEIKNLEEMISFADQALYKAKVADVH